MYKLPRGVVFFDLYDVPLICGYARFVFCVCACVGVLGRLWASLIKECAEAELLFLRSNFKVMERLIFGLGKVSVSPQTLTRLMMDKTARRDAAGMISFFFFFFLCGPTVGIKQRARSHASPCDY